MSETPAPSLSQYFGSEEHKQESETSNDILETSNRITNLKLDDSIKDQPKNEPEVCRIFAEAMPPAKDSTAAFFDLIGNSHTTATNGLISDLGISTNNDVSYLLYNKFVFNNLVLGYI